MPLDGHTTRFSFVLLVAGSLGILDEFCLGHRLLQERDVYQMLSIKSKIELNLVVASSFHCTIKPCSHKYTV